MSKDALWKNCFSSGSHFVKWRWRTVASGILKGGVATVVLTLSGAVSSGALIYQQNFDGGAGDVTPEVTPVHATSTGVLGLAGVPLPAVSATGGVGPASNGVLNHSAITGIDSSNSSTAGTVTNLTTTPGGSGSTSGTGINLGTMNQFTLTFWVKQDSDYSTSATVNYQVLTLGNSSATNGASSANSVGVLLRTGGFASNPSTFDLYANGISGTSGAGMTGGPQVAAGEWAFVALSYDGTSANGDNSVVQGAATGGLSNINGQFYISDDVAGSSLVRTPVPFTTAAGNATATSSGSFVFGTQARLILMNRLGSASVRAFDGWMDDIRIYDTVLTPSEINEIRISAVPEPNAFVLALLGVGLIFGRRSRCRD